MMGVKTQHKEYAKLKPQWDRISDAIDGQDAIHDGGTKYLPKLADQTDADYQSYRDRATYFNASGRTLQGYLGMLFRKAPELVAPANLMPMLDDIDQAGTPWRQFVFDLAEDALEYGRVGILVDHPAMPDGISSLADAERAGLRPRMVEYDADSIINWRTSRINNKTVLSMVVLEEREQIADGFETVDIDQWRVLVLTNEGYKQQVWREDDKGNEYLFSEATPLKNGKPLDFIPFQFLGVDSLSPGASDPPMIDLADMNIAHYRTSADYEHGCHFTGLPTPVVSGYRPEEGDSKLYIGSQSAWVFPDPQATASYLEFSGTGLSALVTNLERKEQAMAVLGARMLESQKAGVESAETAAIHRTGEQSQLAQIANTVSAGFTHALEWMADWAGIGGEVSLQINRDFMPMPMTAQELTAYVASWQAGAISSRVLFDNLKRGEVIGDAVDYETEQENIAAQGLSNAPSA